MKTESIINNRKYYKRNKILNVIRTNDSFSRFDVKKMTLYSIATVGSVIDELIADGLLMETECEEMRVGRKPKLLHLNPDGGYFIGTEFNGYEMHCVVLNFVGNIIYKSKEDISPDFNDKEMIDKLKRHIHDAIFFINDNNNKIFGISVGVPGYIDKETGLAIFYAHIKSWRNIPIKKIIETEFKLPCYIDNNVNVMAYAYKWLGIIGEPKDFLFVSIRTGVRIVPFINNQLIISKTGFSGELGHVKIPHNTRACSCGEIGCLNTEVSDVGIINKIHEGILVGRFPEIFELANHNLANINPALFIQSVLAGDEDSVKLMKSLANILGEALSATVNILAPEMIVLSGNFAKLGSVFITELYNVMNQSAIPENMKKLEIIASSFDVYIGAIGAAILVMQEEFEFIDKTI